MLIEAGITGIVNFAPVTLRVPETVFVENVDMGASLEKAAYFARQRSEKFLDRRRVK